MQRKKYEKTRKYKRLIRKYRFIRAVAAVLRRRINYTDIARRCLTVEPLGPVAVTIDL